MAFIAPLLRVTPGVVMGAALALVVDDPPISKQRAVILIDRRQFAKREIVHQHGRRVDRILRAPAQVNDLGFRHRLGNSYRPGRIR